MSETNDRWRGIKRPYTERDVEQLRGTVRIEHTLAAMGAQRLWELISRRPYVHCLGALSGNQAMLELRTLLSPVPTQTMSGLD